MTHVRVQTYDALAVLLTPESLGDTVRVMTAHQDPDPDVEPGRVREGDHGSVAALCVFEPGAPRFTAITAPGSGVGLVALCRAVPEHVPHRSLVVVAVRVASLTGSPQPGHLLGRLVEPRPGDVDLAFPVTVRDTVRPLIQAARSAVHLDTVLVTEHTWWSIHCTGACPECRNAECLPVPRRAGSAAPRGSTP